MRSIIKSLKVSHTECLDGISNYLVKLSIDSLTMPMTHLYNKCIEKGKFPSIWKLFKIIALYKSKGNKEDPKFYRPIAILCPLSKLLEKEMFHQMMEHMNKNNLWSPNIYAYRKAHNTTTALIDLMETWMNNVDNNFQNVWICPLRLTAWDMKHLFRKWNFMASLMTAANSYYLI